MTKKEEMKWIVVREHHWLATINGRFEAFETANVEDVLLFSTVEDACNWMEKNAVNVASPELAYVGNTLFEGRDDRELFSIFFSNNEELQKPLGKGVYEGFPVYVTVEGKEYNTRYAIHTEGVEKELTKLPIEDEYKQLCLDRVENIYQSFAFEWARDGLIPVTLTPDEMTFLAEKTTTQIHSKAYLDLVKRWNATWQSYLSGHPLLDINVSIEWARGKIIGIEPIKSDCDHKEYWEMFDVYISRWGRIFTLSFCQGYGRYVSPNDTRGETHLLNKADMFDVQDAQKLVCESFPFYEMAKEFVAVLSEHEPIVW